MNKKDQITLYCKSEGWAVTYKNKMEFVQTHARNLVYSYVGEQYKSLRITYKNGAYSNDRLYIEEERNFVCYDYIIRDFNGDPITVKDLPYVYMRKVEQAKINTSDGRPIPNTGKRRRRKRGSYCHKTAKSVKRNLKSCHMAETETEDGVKIPPVRNKCRCEVRDIVFLDWDYHSPNSAKTQSWKEYRKTQWKQKKN